MGSNQPQIHNFMNGNREPTATVEEEEKKNIYLWRYTKIRKKHQEEGWLEIRLTITQQV